MLPMKSYFFASLSLLFCPRFIVSLWDFTCALLKLCLPFVCHWSPHGPLVWWRSFVFWHYFIETVFFFLFFLFFALHPLLFSRFIPLLTHSIPFFSLVGLFISCSILDLYLHLHEAFQCKKNKKKKQYRKNVAKLLVICKCTNAQ